MIVWGVILLLIGAVVAYFGRPREQLIFWAGVIIFVLGLALILLAVLPSDVDLENAGFMVLPLPFVAMAARRGPEHYSGREAADELAGGGGNDGGNGIPLSPTVRWLLTGALTAATAAVTILSDGFQPLDVLLILIALGMGLGLVPPQTGGTQNGVLSPSITEPPSANVDGAQPGTRYIRLPRPP
jgi:uncharacterized membrane protein